MDDRNLGNRDISKPIQIPKDDEDYLTLLGLMDVIIMTTACVILVISFLGIIAYILFFSHLK